DERLVARYYDSAELAAKVTPALLQLDRKLQSGDEWDLAALLPRLDRHVQREGFFQALEREEEIRQPLVFILPADASEDHNLAHRSLQFDWLRSRYGKEQAFVRFTAATPAELLADAKRTLEEMPYTTGLIFHQVRLENEPETLTFIREYLRFWRDQPSAKAVLVFSLLYGTESPELSPLSSLFGSRAGSGARDRVDRFLRDLTEAGRSPAPPAPLL